MKTIDQYSMADPDVSQCPFDYYKAMRNSAPVHFDKDTGCYWVTKYDDVVEAALDATSFSSKNEINLKKTYGPEVQAVLDKAGFQILDTFVTADAPEHDDYRKVGMKLFTPKIVNDIAPKIASLVDELIDGFASKGEADFLTEFAGLLPATVVADEYGFPREDQPRFKAWTDAIIFLQTPGNSPEREVELIQNVIEMFQYLETYISKAANDNDGDSGRVLHALATMPKRDGSAFSMLERCWMALTTFVGGNETTINSLMMGMRKLALNPQLQVELRQHPEKIPTFVEEMLRLESPVQAMIRVATKDVEVAGTVIPKGANVILCAGAANRDEQHWQDADEFSLDRANSNRHLAFGKGRHLCIGLHLARRELSIAFTALIGRLDNIELASAEEDIVQLPLPFHRAIANLKIRFKAV